MRRLGLSCPLLCSLLVASAAIAAPPASAPSDQTAGLSLVVAQPAYAASVTATGHCMPLLNAKLSPRVSGRLVAMGVDEQGRMLDAGMNVKKDQVLFVLDPTTFKNNEAAADAALKAARAALDNLTAKTREEKLDELHQAVVELDARIEDRARDEERYRQLVEVDKTAPVKRLEEVRTDLAAMRAQRAAAAARLREAENGPTKEEIAVAQARVAQAQTALQAAQDDVRDATIRAPFDATIVRRFKGVGDYIANMPPTEVVEITAVDRIEAEFHLPEAYFARLKPGATAVRVASPLLKAPLDLTVTRAIGEIDPAAGTFAFRVAVPKQNGAEGLLPGAFVTGEVKLDAASQEVIIPFRAVAKADGAAHVFVAAEGAMRRRDVELGDRLTEGVIVRSGLKAGDAVLLGPAEALRDGAPLPAYLKADGKP